MYASTDTGKEGKPLFRVTREPAGFFMMDSFLRSRLERNFATNSDVFDEDVNVYIADLLTGFSDPRYHEAAASLVTPYDLGLNERIERAGDSRQRYRIYRINADFLLVSLGIFDNPKRSRPGSRAHLNLTRKSYIGRGKSYYRLAESYLRKAAFGKTATSEVLGKLSEGFENYVKVLGYMKGEYLNLFERISSGEFYHLERSVLNLDREKELRALRDRFLDAYSRYMKDRDFSSREELERAARDIRLLDPSFTFRAN